jgi:hypothetical protein
MSTPNLPMIAVVVAALALTGCGESAAPTTSTRPRPETTALSEGLVVSPQFIQGVIPGAQVVLLVTQGDETAGTATVTATASGGDVMVQPSSITGTEVAEVTVIPTSTEGELAVTIEVSTEQGTESISRVASISPWEDDRGEQAGEILDLFTPWLAETHPELGITPDSEFEGTFVAPELLVVSHYVFFNDQWEIGVAWHVMLPPDDFSEIYLRPRSELSPTLAFRVGSWQTALDTGDYEVMDVEPPSEVTR